MKVLLLIESSPIVQTSVGQITVQTGQVTMLSEKARNEPDSKYSEEFTYLQTT